MRIFFNNLALSLLLFCFLHSHTVIAADPAYEKHLADSALHSTDQGSPQWLKGKDGRFLALYDQNIYSRPQGGVILLPPQGAHPDWPGVIHTLRIHLPRHGWSTLSIQLPALDNNSPTLAYAKTLDSAAARIQSAITFMQSQGIRNIVLIGQGLGANAGAAYLANSSSLNIQAFIGISMGGNKHMDSWLYSPNSIRKMALPILDIYASQDSLHVLNSTQARSNAARLSSLSAEKSFKASAFQHASAESAQTRSTGYIAYRQIIMTGTDGYFSGAEEQLLKRVVGWLKHNAGGVSIKENRLIANTNADQ